MWTHLFMGHPARILALCFFIGTIIGSMLPEFGNIATQWFKIAEAHYFNRYFLVVGLLGIVGFGVALYFRYK